MSAHSNTNGCEITDPGWFSVRKRKAVTVFRALLAGGSQGGADPGVLARRPLKNFNKALELLEKHQTKGYHLTAVTKTENFLLIMQGQQHNIRECMDNAISQTISEIRQKLVSIVETLLMCGRQYRTLRPLGKWDGY